MKIGVLKYFAKLTEKHLCHSLSFKKLATLGTPTHVFRFCHSTTQPRPTSESNSYQTFFSTRIISYIFPQKKFYLSPFENNRSLSLLKNVLYLSIVKKLPHWKKPKFLKQKSFLSSFERIDQLTYLEFSFCTLERSLHYLRNLFEVFFVVLEMFSWWFFRHFCIFEKSL